MAHARLGHVFFIPEVSVSPIFFSDCVAKSNKMIRYVESSYLKLCSPCRCAICMIFGLEKKLFYQFVLIFFLTESCKWRILGIKQSFNCSLHMEKILPLQLTVMLHCLYLYFWSSHLTLILKLYS